MNILVKILGSVAMVISSTFLGIVAGYVAFYLFAFVWGPGLDIDNYATDVERLIGTLAIPSLFGIPIMSFLASILGSYLYFFRNVKKAEQGAAANP